MTLTVFSKCRVAQDLVFLSGEVPFLEDGSIPEGIAAQTELVFLRIARTLKTKNLTLKDIIAVTVYLIDRADFQSFNCIYQTFFSDPLPVRTTLCANLMVDARIEVTVVAMKPHQPL
jgi:2-iminobutanoate/2-iminopropanoate deaminase